jgi:hypothetical protein
MKTDRIQMENIECKLKLYNTNEKLEYKWKIIKYQWELKLSNTNGKDQTSQRLIWICLHFMTFNDPLLIFLKDSRVWTPVACVATTNDKESTNDKIRMNGCIWVRYCEKLYH